MTENAPNQRKKWTSRFKKPNRLYIEGTKKIYTKAHYKLQIAKSWRQRENFERSKRKAIGCVHGN